MVLFTRSIDSTSEADAFTEELLVAIQSSANDSAPWAKPSEESKPYWNKDCENALATGKYLHRIWKDARTEETWRTWMKAVDCTSKVIRSAKTAYWRKVTHEASDTKDLWRLAKWARTCSGRPRQPPQFPALQQEGRVATTFEEKAGALSEKFFPPPEAADLSDIQQATYPPEIGSNVEIKMNLASELSRTASRSKPD